MEQKKLTLEEFNEYKNKLTTIKTEAETMYEQIKDNEDFDEEKYEKEAFEKYFSIQSELLSYDLSSIPFEAWQGFEIFSDETHAVDFSKTKANIDFGLVEYYGNGNFRGCNVKNLDEIRELLNPSAFDEQTIQTNSALFLTDSFSSEFKDKYYNHSLTISDLANLTLQQLEELKQKNFRVHLAYRSYSGLMLETLGLDKVIQLYNHSEQEYEAIRQIFDMDYSWRNISSRNDNTPTFDQFLEQIKNAKVNNIKNVCFDFVRQQIENTNLWIRQENFPELFVNENADIFLVNANIPDEVKERYFNRNLEIQDLLNYPETFQNISVDYFMRRSYISQFVRGNYGMGKFQELVQKHSDVFTHMQQEGEFDQFNQFLKRKKDLESAFTEALKNYLSTHGVLAQFKVTREGQTTYVLPEWLSSMNFQVVEKLNTANDLLQCTDSVFVLDNSQRLVLDTLGIDNIKRLEQETGFFSHKGYEWSWDLEMFNAFSSYFHIHHPDSLLKLGIDFKDGALTYKEFLNQFANCLDNMRKNNVFTDFADYDWIQGEFRNNHPEIFIDLNAPDELKKAFYRNRLYPEFLYQHKEYISYLINKNLSNTIRANIKLNIPGLVDNQGQMMPNSVSFIDEYVSRYGNEKLLKLISKYGGILSDITISSFHDEIENEQKIEKAIRDAIYDNITKENIDYSDLENNPEFVSEYPEIFLKENVPLEIKKKFYSRSLSMADFVQNPNLVDILNNTNVVFGFPFEYMFTNELFAEKDFKTANLKRFKVISEMAQIEDYQLREKFKVYIKKHKDNFNMETLSSLKTVLKRVEYSNSSELRSFKDNFAEKLLNLDDPIAGLEKIEKVFIQNNLPFFAKMFLSFQHIYPDFTKGNVFNFSDTSRIAPQLKDQSLPAIGYHLTPLEKRFRIIYNDLLRITYRSGSLDLMEYLNQLEIGNDLFINYINNGYKQNNFSKEDKQTFDVFMSHLETMYENLSKKEIHNLPLEEKSKILYKTFEPNARYDFKDRVVRTFCYSAGITTFSQLKELVISSKKEADERGRKYAEELESHPFEFEKGDFVRGMGDFESLSGSLAIGNVCKEQLISIKQTSDTDTTPLDIDITLVNNKPSDIYHAVNDTPTGFGFGNVFQIIKKDNPNFVITRDKDGNLTNESYNPLKAELFGTHIKETGEGYETHWGARTGVAMTDIDYLLYKQDRIIDGDKPYDESGNVNYIKLAANPETNTQGKNDDEVDLDIIKYEIAKNGYYLPVIDFSGKLIYPVEEYENIRNMMQGLSHYGVSEYKLSDHLNLPECSISSELTLPSSEWISSQLKETDQETVIKREKIKQVLKPVFDEFNLSIKEEIDGDLTPGSVEFIDTGSTGRGTNKPHDGDFDFLLRLDNDLLLDSNRKNKFMARLREVIETYPHSDESFTTGNGDFRYKKVKLDEETTIDLDLSFVGKTNKVMYSSDMCVKDRLATIKKQYPEQYDLVVANIIQAKLFLKSQGVYKPFRSDKTQGGLGGIGVENWILQHGGSFIDAATSFVQASEGKEFQEFKKDYQIWDFGANHFADRKNIDFNPTLYQKIDAYPYDNFVTKNMSEAGYNKMRQALKQFLNSYTIVNNQNYSIETENNNSITR